MMLFSRKCEACRKRLSGKEGLSEEVEVYGLVGTHKRSFCSEKCLEMFKEATSFNKKNKRFVCTSCIR